jgi:lysophospholipase L1-like esterase
VTLVLEATGGSCPQPPECPAMTRRARPIERVGALLTAPVLLLVGAACSSEHGSAAIAPYGTDDVVSVPAIVSPGQDTPNRAITVEHLAMVGDSITVGSKDALQGAFAGIGVADADINAEGGRRMIKSSSISSGLDGIEAVKASGTVPDVWVIALGTNDVANYRTDEYAAAINKLLAALPAAAKVVWVDCYLRTYQAQSQEFDTVLREVLAARGNARVVDWASVAAEDGMLVDGVHPSGFGRDEFSRRVAQTVADWMS